MPVVVAFRFTRIYPVDNAAFPPLRDSLERRLVSNRISGYSIPQINCGFNTGSVSHPSFRKLFFALKHIWKFSLCCTEL